MRPIIVTPYNNAIDPGIVYHQRLVVDKLRKGIPFFAYDYTGSDMMHGDACNRLIHKMFYEYQEGADCILLLDIDCIPLSVEAIEYTFSLAYNGHLAGNIQRSNHYENDQHVYAAPSYMCFTRETYERAYSPTMNFSKRYDCGELLTVNCRKSDVSVKLFMPSRYESTNEEGGLWDLADGMPKYGIGTTFSDNSIDISYHLFCSRTNRFNRLFIDRCRSIL